MVKTKFGKKNEFAKTREISFDETPKQNLLKNKIVLKQLDKQNLAKLFITGLQSQANNHSHILGYIYNIEI